MTDLPGIYSLSPYSNEEIVTRDFLLQNKPTGIINIVDATNIERNLYLTHAADGAGHPHGTRTQHDGRGPRQRRYHRWSTNCEELLGIPVVPISAARNEGIDELIDHAIHVARHREAPGRIDFCDADDPDDPRARFTAASTAIVHLIEDHARRAGLPPRFAATKLVEGDQPMLEQLSAGPE